MTIEEWLEVISMQLDNMDAFTEFQLEVTTQMTAMMEKLTTMSNIALVIIAIALFVLWGWMFNVYRNH